jgi:hypothetical protein
MAHPQHQQTTRSGQRNTCATGGANIVRLPIFRDGVFIGNEFIPISPRLRAHLRRIAEEARS